MTSATPAAPRCWARLIVAVAALLVVSGCATADGGSAASTPRPLSSEAARGRTVYVEIAEPSCAQCHALAGTGTDAVAGPALDGMALERSNVVDVVERGRGLMPAYEGQLSPEQIEAVATFVAEASAP